MHTGPVLEQYQSFRMRYLWRAVHIILGHSLDQAMKTPFLDMQALYVTQQQTREWADEAKVAMERGSEIGRDIIIEWDNGYEDNGLRFAYVSQFFSEALRKTFQLTMKDEILIDNDADDNDVVDGTLANASNPRAVATVCHIESMPDDDVQIRRIIQNVKFASHFMLMLLSYMEFMYHTNGNEPFDGGSEYQAFYETEFVMQPNAEDLDLCKAFISIMRTHRHLEQEVQPIVPNFEKEIIYRTIDYQSLEFAAQTESFLDELSENGAALPLMRVSRVFDYKRDSRNRPLIYVPPRIGREDVDNSSDFWYRVIVQRRPSAGMMPTYPLTYYDGKRPSRQEMEASTMAKDDNDAGSDPASQPSAGGGTGSVDARQRRQWEQLGLTSLRRLDRGEASRRPRGDDDGDDDANPRSTQQRRFRCAVCGRREPALACSGRRCVQPRPRYCSRACAKRHWAAGHAFECGSG